MINYGWRESWQWLGGPDVIQFTAHDNGKPIICRVSQECIEDNCGR